MKNLLDTVLQQKYKLEEETGKKPTTLFISSDDFAELTKEIGLLKEDKVSIELSIAGLSIEFADNKTPLVK